MFILIDLTIGSLDLQMAGQSSQRLIVPPYYIEDGRIYGKPIAVMIPKNGMQKTLQSYRE